MFPCQGLEGTSALFACTARMLNDSDCPRHSRLRHSFFFVVICEACFSAARNCTNHPNLPTCKAKANEQGKWLRNQDSLHVLYAS